MPVMSPADGGIPDAMATPMHKGKATRNTTSDDKKSGRQAFKSKLMECLLLFS